MIAMPPPVTTQRAARSTTSLLRAVRAVAGDWERLAAAGSPVEEAGGRWVSGVVIGAGEQPCRRRERPGDILAAGSRSLLRAYLSFASSSPTTFAGTGM